MPGHHDAKAQRKDRLRREGRYGENDAGKWVRSSAFREIDYDPENPEKVQDSTPLMKPSHLAKSAASMALVAEKRTT